MAAMPGVPLYNARIDDLQFADTISVECLECRRQSHVQISELKARLPEWYRVMDLPRILKCENCGTAGRAVVNARQALGYGTQG